MQKKVSLMRSICGDRHQPSGNPICGVTSACWQRMVGAISESTTVRILESLSIFLLLRPQCLTSTTLLMMPRPDEQRAILSSLPLEVLLYFNQYFSWCFLALAICTYSYKAWRYYYPSGALELEISLLFLYGAVEMMRLFLASKGNKAEQINPLMMSLGLAVPVIFLYAFSLALQTYVLRLDVIVAVLGLVFVVFEGLLSIGTAISFYRAFRG